MLIAQETQPWSRYGPYMAFKKILVFQKRDVILLLWSVLLGRC